MRFPGIVLVAISSVAKAASAVAHPSLQDDEISKAKRDYSQDVHATALRGARREEELLLGRFDEYTDKSENRHRILYGTNAKVLLDFEFVGYGICTDNQGRQYQSGLIYDSNLENCASRCTHYTNLIGVIDRSNSCECLFESTEQPTRQNFNSVHSNRNISQRGRGPIADMVGYVNRNFLARPATCYRYKNYVTQSAQQQTRSECMNPNLARYELPPYCPNYQSPGPNDVPRAIPGAVIPHGSQPDYGPPPRNPPSGSRVVGRGQCLDSNMRPFMSGIRSYDPNKTGAFASAARACINNSYSVGFQDEDDANGNRIRCLFGRQYENRSGFQKSRTHGFTRSTYSEEGEGRVASGDETMGSYCYSKD